MKQSLTHVTKAALLGAFIGAVAGFVIADYTLNGALDGAFLGALIGTFFTLRTRTNARPDLWSESGHNSANSASLGAMMQEQVKNLRIWD